MAYNRFLPLIVPFLTGVLMEIYFFNNSSIYVVLISILLIFMFTVRQFRKASNVEEEWWNLLILPVLFTSSLIIFTTMATSKLLVQLLFVFNVIFLYFYLISIFYYLSKSSKYSNYSLENLSSYGNFLTFYFIASGIYGMQAFLGIKIWVLMLVFLLFISLIIYQVLWANKIEKKEGFLYMLISVLILIELAWSASFLTLSYYILGLILAVCYYILIGMVRFYLLGTLDKKKIKMYLTFGFSSIIIVLITARWI